MKLRGVCYDTGIETTVGGQSRPVFMEAIARHEIGVIQDELHCNAISISGQDSERMRMAASIALERGMHVWFTPRFQNDHTTTAITKLAGYAKVAEALRQQSPQITLVLGVEATLFLRGMVTGRTMQERMRTFGSPWRLIASAIRRKPFNTNLNAFLREAHAVASKTFKGSISYASGSWESVDWSLFDYVSVDYYRDPTNTTTYREKLQAYKQHGKPVVITEFGCCTYEGASQKGGYGWAIVDHSKTPPEIKGERARSEAEQAQLITELVDIFEEEQVEGAFAFTFISPNYPHNEDPRYDLDMASYSLVKTLPTTSSESGVEPKWTPKESFGALARAYTKE